MEGAASRVLERAELLASLASQLETPADGTESVRLRLRLHRLHAENEAAAGQKHLAAERPGEPEPLRRARELLRPGAIFSGQICIPGLSQGADGRGGDSAPSGYTLEVLRAVTDGLGRSFLLAHHEAYEDRQVRALPSLPARFLTQPLSSARGEQACYIDLRVDAESEVAAPAPRVSLSYSDAETLCAGHIAPPDPGGRAPACVYHVFSSPLSFLIEN